MFRGLLSPLGQQNEMAECSPKESYINEFDQNVVVFNNTQSG